MKNLLILCLSFLGLSLGAQDFEVAPVLMSFKGEPGTISVKILNVKNYANVKQKFSLSISDYTLNVNGAKKSAVPGSTANSIAPWLTINPSILDLNPNEAGHAEILLTVPNGNYNSRWGMIHVEVAKEKTAKEADKNLATGVVIVPRIVVLLKQEPESNTNYSGKITNLAEVTGKNDVIRKFTAILVNDGEKIIDADVYLALANVTTAEEKSFDTQSITVYPGYSREIELSLPGELAAGEYALAAIMDYGHRKPIEGIQIMLQQK